jgi:hypothetical protein
VQPAAAQQIQPSTAQPVQHRAVIVYSLGQLTVLAENSSLNQILRDVARQTGMKITGGVADQRVYGKYGPAPTAEILAELLDGTGINMMLRETVSSAPAELILTPRLGGPSPPDPDAARENADRDDPGEVAPAPVSQSPRTPWADYLPGGETVPGQPAHPPPAGVYIPPPPPPVPVKSPNGVATPQQIYQQLQQMQQTQPANP